MGIKENEKESIHVCHPPHDGHGKHHDRQGQSWWRQGDDQAERWHLCSELKQGLLNKWYGMKAAKASTTQVDGVTRATFSCKAVKENVKRGAKYYLKNK